MTIPVICDRCRVAGTAGTGDFSHFGDLLEFDPVPRQPRVNGWDADAQRAFIALLATTGSKRRAALAIGRNVFGVDQLLKDQRGTSFRTAYDRAMAIAKQNGAMKLATGVADAAARNAQLAPPSRLKDLPLEREGAGMSEDEKIDVLNTIFNKFLGKVEAERKARLAGEVVAADHYLRQITFVEIAFDMMAERLNMDPWMTMGEFRRAGANIFEIAETDMSRLLDAHRRELWKDMNDPDRPEHPPQRYLFNKGPISIEPQEHSMEGEEGRKLKSEYARRHREDAEAQARWEAGAAERSGAIAKQRSAQPCRGHGEH